ncbi:ComEC/Rec2 family competence protein [Winogradskyella sp. KYW1333]|uniref:ComEC/Rec2 family competence protein n=1 Tax=Winogradskyella sp. KYW1333 TaxID=2282123 RepID=UPI000DF30D07|nr:ComEC/Rec2 family competence protein [Winogradskyella sp. KYW1333]RCT54025.1 ComEC family competence protein [Winogradskyella sp. KYW1333]
MNLLNFNIIKLTFCLILGIVLAHYLKLNQNLILLTTTVLLVAIGIILLILKNKIDRLPFFGALTYLCMIGIGINAYNLQDQKTKTSHYSHKILEDKNNIFIFKVVGRLKSDAYNDKYIVKIKSINNQESSGKILINIKHDSLKSTLGIDDIVFASTIVNDIQKPLNPYQFDYRKYLELKQVYHQLYLNSDALKIITNNKTTIYGYADKLRVAINKNLIEAGFKNDVLGIINALLLGQRQSIDKSIYNSYVNSGTIHILAVSGLHVGILLWILNFILRPFLYLRNGRILRPLIIIILLWSFAVIAGLSPSVTRAVTMFSIISIAMHYKRPTNIYNTLFISAFLILLFKPIFLFEVGFQLSYLAVFGIVSFQPILYKLWKPKFLIPDKLWQIFTVTLAAQIGVVPISLFYFHQFPGLFFISNLVVIPFLSLILGFGLFVIIMALLDGLNKTIVDVYSFIIELLNDFISWIAQFESFLLKDIPFTIFQVLLAYLIVVGAIQTYKKRVFKWLAICFIGVIGFQVIQLNTKHHSLSDVFIVFNKSRFTMIGQKLNSQLIVHHNLNSEKRKYDNVISNYKIGESISEVVEDSIQYLYNFQNNKILVIDSLGVYKNLSFKPDMILLRNSPKINLNRLIDNINPKLIIADASNFKSYVFRWKSTCEDKKIPFHYTNEKGALILK